MSCAAPKKPEHRNAAAELVFAPRQKCATKSWRTALLEFPGLFCREANEDTSAPSLSM
jgi:hypothetical protein